MLDMKSSINIEEDVLGSNQEVILAKKDSGYRVFLSKVGYREFSIHSSLEYIYVIKGQLKIKIEKKIVVLKENDLIFIGSNIAHVIDYVEEDNISLVLQVDPEDFEDGDKLKQIKSRLITSEDEKDNFKIGLANLYKKSIGVDISEDKLEKYLKTIIAYDPSDFRFIDDTDDMSIDNIVIEIVKDLQSRISESGDIRLEALAKEYSISYSHLSRKFKSIIGETYREYLLKLRLNYAVNLLINTDDLITNVAIDAGFKSIKNFNRSFKEYFKIPPSDFRKKYNLEEKILYNEALHNDEKTQNFLREISSMDDESLGDLSFRLDDKLLFKNDSWRKVIDLHSIINLERDISNLQGILEDYKNATISMRIRLKDGKFHLASGRGELIALSAEDRKSLVKALDYNKIKPIIQLYFPLKPGSLRSEFVGSKTEKDLYKLLDYKNYVLDNVESDNLKGWKLELYLDNIEEAVKSDEDVSHYNMFLDSFIRNAIRDLKLPCENIGIYIGKIHIFNNNDFIDKLKRLNFNKYPGCFYRLDILCDSEEKNYEKSYEFLKNEIIKVKDVLGIVDNEKLVVSFNFVDNFTSDDKNFKSYYYSVLYLKIYLNLVKLNIHISSINIVGRDYMEVRDYVVENTAKGIKRTTYYISKLIENLESDIIYLSERVLVTRDDKSISLVMLPKLMEKEEFSMSRGKDILNVNISGLDGEYKETQYEILRDVNFIEDSRISITDREYMYYQTMNMPRFKIDFKEISGDTSLEIEKEAHTIKLIKLTNMES